MIWIACFFAVSSLLAVFRAPAKPFWYVAILVTEWGHYWAIAAAVFALVGWRITGRWGLANWITLSAAGLFMTPLLRAVPLSRSLPGQLTAAFGPADRGLAPLEWAALFRGPPTFPVRFTTQKYGVVEGEPLWLDLYRPENSSVPLPGVVVIHSGSWKTGTRGEFQEFSRYLAANGYIVACIDYRLAPHFRFPAQQDDVFTSIHYLRRHAREIGLDANRLALLGRSAGGQIALSAAYAQKDPAIKGVIVFAAPNDLAWAYTVPTNPLIMNSRAVLENYLGESPVQIPNVYQAASPLHFVNKTTPPTLMIHGARDELVWSRHEERLSERLRAAGRPHYYLCLPWATHACDYNFNGPSGQLSRYAVTRFLSAVTRLDRNAASPPGPRPPGSTRL